MRPSIYDNDDDNVHNGREFRLDTKHTYVYTSDRHADTQTQRTNTLRLSVDGRQPSYKRPNDSGNVGDGGDGNG